MSEVEYWNGFYNKQQAVNYPSRFAEFCLSKFITPGMRILEIGSGNGRDSFYFAENGVHTIGLDQSDVVTKANSERALQLKLDQKLNFVCADFSNITEFLHPNLDALYSRFSLHSVSEEVRHKVMRDVYQSVHVGFVFCIEVRTNKDDLFGVGKKLSANEFSTDHYRSFLDANQFLAYCLSVGWNAKYFVEAKDLAVYKNENPIVANYVFTKPR